MAAAAIPLAAAGLQSLMGLFGSNPGKKTRKMLRKMLQRLLPQLEGELRQRYADYRDLYGTSVPFLKGLVPTSFSQLSPYASSLRDQMLQSQQSGLNSALVGGMGTLNRKFGFRAPAGAYASFLGQLGRAGSEGRTDIRRQAVQENTRMGLVGSEGLRAWAGQGDPVLGTQSFANLAAAAGLPPSSGGFGANLDFNAILKALNESGVFGGKKTGSFNQLGRDFTQYPGLMNYFTQLPSTPAGSSGSFSGLLSY